MTTNNLASDEAAMRDESSTVRPPSHQLYLDGKTALTLAEAAELTGRTDLQLLRMGQSTLSGAPSPTMRFCLTVPEDYQVFKVTPTLLGQIVSRPIDPDDSLNAQSYLFVTNRPHDLALEDKHVQTAILAEGFQIPGFKLDTAYPSLRAAHQSRKEHADMHQLLESLRVHSEIPTTFDGTPPELAFAGQTQRLIIGETYLVPDSKGAERPGKLTSATVNELESKAYVAHYLDNGEAVIGTVPLTPEELAAYRRHPDTFFGVEMKATRKAETPLDLFDFIMDSYRDTPRGRLLEFMADNPDIEELKTMSKEDLTEIYAERCAWSVMERTENPTAK